MRRPLALLLLAVLPLGALAACGGDDAASSTSNPDVDAVEITDGKDADTAPTLKFDEPLSVDETATRVVEEGDGDQVKDGATAIFDFVLVNGRDGTVLGSSYESDPAEIAFADSLVPGIHQGLDGQKAGSRVLVAMAPEDGLGADEQQGVKEDDTILFLADIHAVRFPLQRAEGTAVTPPPGLPTVTLAKDGTPTITVPKAPAPTELVVQPLIEGTGAKVEKGQTITVHYVGANYADGKVFDSSWAKGEPASFEIGTGKVIPAWDKALVGQKVGSQLLLVVPPADGYGAAGSGDAIPPNATLVFVVDILDAHDAVTPAS